ncbi:MULTISPECIES: hypothetical protein [Emticicia]|uniref:hypothetical protein n=1 Tax=Emticicia TaxID=312278 RepID=UPI0007D8A581|nr:MULTISPECIES: hypothetical protein [Emticicia]
MSVSAQSLNDVQLNLLKLFSRKMSETEQAEINEILLKYYDNLLQKEVQRAINLKGYTKEDIENVLGNSQRTK